jgi:hypothetical protein
MDRDLRESLRRTIDALVRSLAAERIRHLGGLEPEPALARIYAAHAPAARLETARALRDSGDTALAAQVSAAWADWRASEHEEAWRAAEVVAVVEGPDGRLGLAAAEAAMVRQPDRERRRLLARAIAQALEGPARHREAAAEARVRARAEAGLVPDWPAVVEGDQLLGATDDAWRDLLAFFVRRDPGLAAASGGLDRADLLHLLAFGHLDGLFRPSALAAAIRTAAGDLGLDPGRLRIDEARRHETWPGAHVENDRVVFCARGGLPDWPDLLDALGRALAASLHPPHGRDAVFGPAIGALLAGLCLEPRWLRDRLDLERRQVPDVLRAVGMRRLLGLRAAAAALRVATEVQRGLSGAAWREAHREGLSGALQATWEGVLASHDADPAPLAATLRGFAAGERLRLELRERFDEDWWRNPRTREHLAGLLAAGRLPAAQPGEGGQGGAGAGWTAAVAGAGLARLLERGSG